VWFVRNAAHKIVDWVYRHSPSHENGGADEVSVTGLSGLLADDQHVLDAEVKAIKLDDFTAPDDNTDLDATDAKHGLMPKADKAKLDGVAAGANLYVHPNHSGEVTSVADGAQTITNDAVTYAKMQNVSATDKVLGRSTAGAGDVEEIACTAAGRALLDDAAASNQRTTLGLAIGTDVLAQQTIGIADGNLVKIDHAAVADDDYAKFTANGLEGRSYSEVLSDIAAAGVSTANKTIYVYAEATGDADGTSKANGFTTAQAAWNSLEAIIAHAYTIIVCAGTKKTGTADENTANHLVDDGNSQFVSGDVGKRVFNVGTGAWGVVGSFVDTGDVGIVDTAGANLDLFPAGTEAYVIEPTPYREQVAVDSKYIIGSVLIRTEFYWQGDCDTQANAGEILDATADFTNVEVGDKIVVLDLNGANGRAQDYEVGTVDDVSQVGSDIVRTTLTKTPTAGWIYTIVKTEISGSDDGLDSGTARNHLFWLTGVDNVDIYGFLLTFSDSWSVRYTNSRNCDLYYFYHENTDMGPGSLDHSQLFAYYGYIEASTANNWIYGFYSYRRSVALAFYVALEQTGSAFYAAQQTHIEAQYCYIDTTRNGMWVDLVSAGYFNKSTISGNATTGIYARRNSSVLTASTTNSGVTPEDPAGTVEGAYIA